MSSQVKSMPEPVVATLPERTESPLSHRMEKRKTSNVCKSNSGPASAGQGKRVDPLSS